MGAIGLVALTQSLLAAMIGSGNGGNSRRARIPHLFGRPAVLFCSPDPSRPSLTGLRSLECLTWTGVPAELGTFIPWSVLLLAFWGRCRIDAPHLPTSRRWLALWVGVFFVLSLGPFLHIGGTVYDSVVLPYGWLEKIPGLGIMRAPIRFHLMTYLGVCLLVWCRRGGLGATTVATE